LPRVAGAKGGVELDQAVGDTLGDSRAFEELMRGVERSASDPR
jgi:hypothetical protein